MCQFINETYHVIELNANYFTYCTDKTPFDNFAFEVQMTIIQGDCGGIIFRAAGTVGNNYFFQICQNGTYALYTIGSNNSISKTLIRSKSSHAVHSGLNQANTIAVVANGATLTLYVNYQNIDHITDATYSRGQLGFVAYPENQTTEVIYSNAKVWQ